MGLGGCRAAAAVHARNHFPDLLDHQAVHLLAAARPVSRSLGAGRRPQGAAAEPAAGRAFGGRLRQQPIGDAGLLGDRDARRRAAGAAVRGGGCAAPDRAHQDAAFRAGHKLFVLQPELPADRRPDRGPDRPAIWGAVAQPHLRSGRHAARRRQRRHLVGRRRHRGLRGNGRDRVSAGGQPDQLDRRRRHRRQPRRFHRLGKIHRRHPGRSGRDLQPAVGSGDVSQRQAGAVPASG